MTTPIDRDPLLLDRDPEIDTPELLQRAQENAAGRPHLPPLPAAHGRARLAAERERLIKTVKDLQERVRDYGLVETHKTGWKGVVDLFIKKSVRKLIQRHLLQQHRIHLKLLTTLNRLLQYLEEHDQCVRAGLDLADRQCADRARPLTVTHRAWTETAAPAEPHAHAAHGD